jgi:hypothetical protein
MVVVGLVLVIALYLFLWHRAVLVPISPERSAERRRFNVMALFVLAILSLLH